MNSRYVIGVCGAVSRVCYSAGRDFILPPAYLLLMYSRSLYWLLRAAVTSLTPLTHASFKDR